MPALLDHRFLFVVGKGGVGKTTVSAAIGLAAARKGKRVLIAMANARERLSHMLESEPVGEEILEITPNLHAVNMNPPAALKEYGLMVLKVRAVYEAVFENRIVRAFLRGTPGLEAWSMLGKAYFHAVGHGPEGRGQYDLVILDAPATGHGLDMLRVPQVIVDVAPPGLLRREAERVLELFRDASRAGVVPVTLPEDMPVSETIELYEAVRDELRMPVPMMVVNSRLSRIFRHEERLRISTLPSTLPETSALQPLAIAGRERVLREELQDEAVKRLADAVPDIARHELPHLFVRDLERANVEALSYVFG